MQTSQRCWNNIESWSLSSRRWVAHNFNIFHFTQAFSLENLSKMNQTGARRTHWLEFSCFCSNEGRGLRINWYLNFACEKVWKENYFFAQTMVERQNSKTVRLQLGEQKTVLFAFRFFPFSITSFVFYLLVILRTISLFSDLEVLMARHKCQLSLAVAAPLF